MEIPHGNYVFGIIFASCKKCNENDIEVSLMIQHSLALCKKIGCHNYFEYKVSKAKD
jgi:hypothetical protein